MSMNPYQTENQNLDVLLFSAPRKYSKSMISIVMTVGIVRSRVFVKQLELVLK
jgi:hypothetical protein